MRAKTPILLLMAMVGLGYGLYPYIALYRIETAIRLGDPVLLAKLIDWPAVREGIKEDICDRVLDEPAEASARHELRPFGASFVRGVAGNVVDRAISVENLVAATRPSAADQASPPRDHAQINWAFFNSPMGFLVDVTTPGVSAPIRVQMELRGLSWIVRRVSLPPALLDDNHFHT